MFDLKELYGPSDAAGQDLPNRDLPNRDLPDRDTPAAQLYGRVRMLDTLARTRVLLITSRRERLEEIDAKIGSVGWIRDEGGAGGAAGGLAGGEAAEGLAVGEAAEGSAVDSFDEILPSQMLAKARAEASLCYAYTALC